MIKLDGLGTVFVVCLLLAAFIGWAVIEGLLWLISHVSVTLR